MNEGLIKPEQLPIDEYHASDAITSTKIRQFIESPETYKDRLNGTHPDCNRSGSDPRYFFFGNLFEDMITLDTEQLAEMYYFCKGGEPERPQDRVINAKKPSQESKEKIAAWYAFLDAVGDRRIVSYPECRTIEKMLAGYYNNSTACQLWNSTEKQLTIRKKYKSQTLQCRFDGVNTQTDIAVDLKTTSKPLEQFSKAIYDYRYDLQLAWYSELYHMQFKRELKEFKFIVCETIYPYRCQVIELPDGVIQSANFTIINAVKDMIDCIDSMEFPTTPETATASFTQWQLEEMGL